VETKEELVLMALLRVVAEEAYIKVVMVETQVEQIVVMKVHMEAEIPMAKAAT
jgi:hypothetical protein